MLGQIEMAAPVDVQVELGGGVLAPPLDLLDGGFGVVVAGERRDRAPQLRARPVPVGLRGRVVGADGRHRHPHDLLVAQRAGVRPAERADLGDHSVVVLEVDAFVPMRGRRAPGRDEQPDRGGQTGPVHPQGDLERERGAHAVAEKRHRAVEFRAQRLEGGVGELAQILDTRFPPAILPPRVLHQAHVDAGRQRLGHRHVEARGAPGVRQADQPHRTGTSHRRVPHPEITVEFGVRHGHLPTTGARPSGELRDRLTGIMRGGCASRPAAVTPKFSGYF